VFCFTPVATFAFFIGFDPRPEQRIVQESLKRVIANSAFLVLIFGHHGYLLINPAMNIEAVRLKINPLPAPARLFPASPE